MRQIEILVGDLRDADAVRRAVRGCNFVFHLGALVGIPYYYVNPADVVSTNVMGSLNVLQACLDAEVDRVVQTSSSEVYGTARCVPMDEHHSLNPQSPYAASKVAGDKLAESFFRTYGLPVTVLRPFNTYGPRQSPRAVIPTIITQALSSRKVRLGSLEPSRDLTFVTDTARGFIAAALSAGAKGATVQLGSNRETTVAELVEMIGKLLGKKLEPLPDTARRRPRASEVERLVASNQRARELLGWKPRVSLSKGLEKTIAWFKSRAGKYKLELYYI
jgi:dTDP-glucose 4,6-dehydratase